MRPEFTDMMEAARVASFMEEASYGRWKIRHFQVSEHRHNVDVARAIAEGGPNRDARIARTVPPGDYAMLGRRATPDELEDLRSGEVVDGGFPDETSYVPIMSDTPSEIAEHGHAFEHAKGYVLITGLGLGVLVSALLAKPCNRDRCSDGWVRIRGDSRSTQCPDCKGTGKAVEHITVVEIDRDVIALTGPYYDGNDRVAIYNADALAFARSIAEPGTLVLSARDGDVLGHPFDYAWHDIWSHISDRNLDDDVIAEHGISYATMFEAYRPFVAKQGAWAWPEAKGMRERRETEEAATIAWAREFIAANPERRVRLLTEFQIRKILGLLSDAPVSPEIYAFFVKNMHYEEAARQMIAGRPMVEDFQRIIDSADEPDDPMARPNEVPEANVAR